MHSDSILRENCVIKKADRLVLGIFLRREESNECLREILSSLVSVKQFAQG